MALRTEFSSLSVRQINPQYFEPIKPKPFSRERPASRLRFQSELRGSTKMPPINYSQASASALSNKNISLSSSKSPVRPLPDKMESILPLLDETSSTDTMMRLSKLLTIETATIEPKRFAPPVPFTNKALQNPSPMLEASTTNPMTTKMKDKDFMSTNTTTARSYNGLKARLLSTPKLFPLKGSTAFMARKLTMNDAGTINTIQNPETSSIDNPLKNLSGSTASNYFPLLEPTRRSNKVNGVIKAYGANTNQGLVRNYNEDRVAIILNITKPAKSDKDMPDWPACSFFGMYDGHGGTACADFLRDNLHHLVIKDPSFPFNPTEALKNGFQEAERQFTELARQQPYEIEKSGSCGLVVLIIDEVCYVANVGDSRAVMSYDYGAKAVALSRDHKPDDDDERNRIQSLGGKVYQSQIPQPMKMTNLFQPPTFVKPLLGPHRVFPGRLSVSRTFGDIEAKITEYGGIPGVVSAEPEIKAFKITRDSDFIILGCDGIFDKMSDEDVVNKVWESSRVKCSDLHQQVSLGVESVLNESMFRKSLDNVTVVMIALAGFKRLLFPADSPTSFSADKSLRLKDKRSFEVSRERTALGAKRFQSTGRPMVQKLADLELNKGGVRKLSEAQLGDVQSTDDTSETILSAILRMQEPLSGDIVPRVQSESLAGYGDLEALKRSAKSVRRLR